MRYLHMKLYFLLPSRRESHVVPQGSTPGPVLFMLENLNRITIPLYLLSHIFPLLVIFASVSTKALNERVLAGVCMVKKTKKTCLSVLTIHR